MVGQYEMREASGRDVFVAVACAAECLHRAREPSDEGHGRTKNASLTGALALSNDIML